MTLVSSLKLSPAVAISALEKWTPLAGRGQVSEIKFKNYYNNISIHLIDETYNANPGSVKSSLETLACIFPNKKNLLLESTFIHGFLHLLGHDHKKLKDYKVMNKEEIKILNSIN